VAGIGDQCERVGHQAGDGFGHDEAHVERDADDEGARQLFGWRVVMMTMTMVMVVRVMVIVAMVIAMIGVGMVVPMIVAAAVRVLVAHAVGLAF